MRGVLGPGDSRGQPVPLRPPAGQQALTKEPELGRK